MGEPLDSLGPRYAGEVSTAAGRYQINRPTWEHVSARLALTNFSPASQDDAAVELVKEAGALDAVNAGDLATAVERCAHIWASLPGSTSGQPEAKMAALIGAFVGAGGTLA
jgi:muramidase (phage lysozyme)